MAREKIILDIQAEVANAKKRMKSLETSVSGVNKQVSKSNELFGKAAVALGSFFAVQKVIEWGKVVGNVVIDFQKQMSGLSAITGAVGKDLDFMARKAIEFGVDMKKSAKDVVEAFQLVGSAKPELLKNAAALAEVTKQAIILSQAARIEVAEAANIVTKALNVWGKGAESAAKFTDILADSQKKGTAVVQQLGESIRNAGSIAASVGLTFEATNAALQAFAKGGLDGLQAGTGLGIVLRKLGTQAKNEFNPAFNSMTDVLDNLAEKGYGDLRKASELVGEEGARFLLTLIQQREVVRELEFDLGEMGVAMGQAETNTDNLRGALDEVKASFDAFILTIETGEGTIANVFQKAIEGVSLVLQRSTNKVEAATATRKTLGPMWKALFAGSQEEASEAIEDARVQAVKIGAAMGEGLLRISDFFGFDNFFGLTKEHVEFIAKGTIVEPTEDAGDDAGEGTANAFKKSFIESMSDEEFRKYLQGIKLGGVVEEDEGSVLETWMFGDDKDAAAKELMKDFGKFADELAELRKRRNEEADEDARTQIEREILLAETSIEIERRKQATKHDLLTGALAAAGAALQDSAIASTLFAIAESIASTYLTAQFAAQSQAAIPVVGPILAESARAQAITAGWINTALIAAVNIPKFFGEGGYTGTDTYFKDPQGKPIAGFVHQNEFVFNEEKTRQLRPFFEDIHNDRIDAKGLAALTRRGVIMPTITNEFNSKILERAVDKIYNKMGERDPERYIQKTDKGYIKKVGNTTIIAN